VPTSALNTGLRLLGPLFELGFERVQAARDDRAGAVEERAVVVVVELLASRSCGARHHVSLL
jgi:hypothetical protein